MSLEKVLDAASTQVGYSESPANSNRTKYGAAYGLDGQPWCVMFLWWVFRTAGEQEAFYGGGKTASCGALLRYYREQGLTAAAAGVRPGDILILNFHGTQDTEHCGLVESVTEGRICTIEGNTSASGSQANGGAVQRKTRVPAQIVGVCRPRYRAAASDYAGHWAEAAIDRCRELGLMQGDPDGKFRPNDPVTRAELAAVLMRQEGK